eukprot:3218382-Prymnesium_polylepis.1
MLDGQLGRVSCVTPGVPCEMRTCGEPGANRRELARDGKCATRISVNRARNGRELCECYCVTCAS